MTDEAVEHGQETVGDLWKDPLKDGTASLGRGSAVALGHLNSLGRTRTFCRGRKPLCFRVPTRNIAQRHEHRPIVRLPAKRCTIGYSVTSAPGSTLAMTDGRYLSPQPGPNDSAPDSRTEPFFQSS